jgi:hypothetical protein
MNNGSNGKCTAREPQGTGEFWKLLSNLEHSPER